MTHRNSPQRLNGRIKHSIVPWCFEVFGEKWDITKICQVAVELGCESVELVKPEDFPILRQHGLQCALGAINMEPDAPFVKGF
ncbi:MAG: hydroxypyruvate isomerase, partial [Verrucomicrobiota bacterium]